MHALIRFAYRLQREQQRQRRRQSTRYAQRTNYQFLLKRRYERTISPTRIFVAAMCGDL